MTLHPSHNLHNQQEVEPHRSQELDLLRGLAICLVLGRHLTLLIEPAALHSFPSMAQSLILLCVRIGWIGVDLFFVLSGFLVSGLLFSEYKKCNNVQLIRFFIRRALRIFPPFYIYLTLSISIIYFFKLPPSLALDKILSEIIFVQNYLPSLWWHSWSLAVEEHFYTLLIFFCFILQRFYNRNHEIFHIIPRCALYIFSFCLLSRIVASYYTHLPWQSIVCETQFRLDALFSGVYISYFYHFHREALIGFFLRFQRTLLFLLCATLIPAFLLPIEDSRFMQAFGLSLLSVAFTIFLLKFLFYPHYIKQRFLHHTRAVSYIGRHSYSIYLWHIPVYFWTFDLIISSHPQTPLRLCLQMAAYLAISISAGLLYALVMEDKILKLRDKYIPSRTKSYS